MDIESTIFKKCKVDFNKLVSYGFKLENNVYIYYQNILNNSFEVIIEIYENGTVKGKIMDLNFNEEYTNYRINDACGDFVGGVRENFINILKDIKNKCFNENFFIGEQANRLTYFVEKYYMVIPEFPWDKYSDYGVFKNRKNNKWFALIMNINKNKLDKLCESKIIEIINVKLDEDMIEELLKKDGFYPAYHMNKKYWISIILDNTLSDKEIQKYILLSYNFTIK